MSRRKAGVDLSVVVPCLNEVHNLAGLLRVLAHAAEGYRGEVEVIVVDGGSTDGTAGGLPPPGAPAPSRPFAALRTLHTAASRARQMNVGAAAARGRILYFVHADTRPPLDCLRAVARAVGGGSRLGGYATEFDPGGRLLRFNAWLTTFNVLATRGGDQSIFCERDTFRRLGGYDEGMAIMEEYGLLRRARSAGIAYRLLPGRTLVSDRKYDGRSWARVQVANVAAVAMWRGGVETGVIARAYDAILGRATPPS